MRIETHTRTEYVRDTLYIEVPSESTAQTVADSSHLETTFAVSFARIDADGRLFHSLHNKPHRAPVEIETPIIYRDSIVYRDRNTTSVIEVERPLTAWQRTQMSGFWVLAAICIVGAVLFLRRLFAFVV